MIETCGSWTRKCRENARKSQDEAAECIGISPRNYQYKEHNERYFTDRELEQLEILFDNPNFAIQYMKLKNPFWEKKLKEAAAAVVALKEIQEQLSLLTPQILGMADFIQSVC